MAPALSRNPMYFGWTFIYIGISFVINSVWITAFLLIVVSYIRFIEIGLTQLNEGTGGLVEW